MKTSFEQKPPENRHTPGSQHFGWVGVGKSITRPQRLAQRLSDTNKGIFPASSYAARDFGS
jgi:hypothetical protein